MLTQTARVGTKRDFFSPWDPSAFLLSLAEEPGGPGLGCLPPESSLLPLWLFSSRRTRVEWTRRDLESQAVASLARLAPPSPGLPEGGAVRTSKGDSARK